MFTFENEQTQEILDNLHALGIKSAIAAGGVVRDCVFGREPKDIDIFVSQDDWFKFERKEINKCLDKKVSMVVGSDYMDIPDVHSIYNVAGEITLVDLLSCEGEVTQLPVQIIVMDEGMSSTQRIDTFDFGFCQVGYDGKQVIHTEHFMKDYIDRTVTLVYCENAYEFKRSMKRYERLSKKFWDLKLIVPEKYSEFEMLNLVPESSVVALQKMTQRV